MLVQEHLAWLDREIARAAASTDFPPFPEPPGTFYPPSPPPPPEAVIVAAAVKATSPGGVRTQSVVTSATAGVSAVPPEAETILQQYRVAPDALRTDVRKGCFLYFAVAFVVVAVGVAFLYVVLRGN